MKILAKIISEVFKKNKNKGQVQSQITILSPNDIVIKEIEVKEGEEREKVLSTIYTYFLSPIGSGHPAIATQASTIINPIRKHTNSKSAKEKAASNPSSKRLKIER